MYGGLRCYSHHLLHSWCAAAVEERGHLYGRMCRITIARRCGSNLRNSSNSEPSVGESETIIKRRMSSPELVRREYADLRLNDNIVSEVGHVRIRQHVNPLSSSFMGHGCTVSGRSEGIFAIENAAGVISQKWIPTGVPSQVPEWKEVYRDTTLPLMVDIGCGSGRFLLWLAKSSTDEKNYLGLEIRHKLVQRAQSWVEELALKNIHFIFANANVSFEQLVFTYPGPLVLVSILCPDPYFKQRHHKRRVVQKPLVQSISRNLHPGGHVFLQSDVLNVAIDMRDQFDALADVFEHVNNYLDLDVPCDKEGWLLSNPLGIRTEREIHAESEGSQIYRRMYQKRA